MGTAENYVENQISVVSSTAMLTLTWRLMTNLMRMKLQCMEMWKSRMKRKKF